MTLNAAIIRPSFQSNLLVQFYEELKFKNRMRIVLIVDDLTKEKVMKAIFSVFAALLLFNISACNRATDDVRGTTDDVTIERQEDYDREDTMERRTLPVETDDEINVDRDVLGDDEVEIDD